MPSEWESPEKRTRLYRRRIRAAIREVEEKRLLLRVAPTLRRHDPTFGCPFHATPEIFFQLEGTTHYRCPEYDFSAPRGAITIVPRGVPHGERTADGRSPFLNIIGMFNIEGFTFHLGRSTPHHRVRSGPLDRFPTPCRNQMIGYLEEIAAAATHATRNPTLVRGLLLAYLALVLQELGAPSSRSRTLSPRVDRAVDLIRINFPDPRLSVSQLAELCGCSPDYLSRRFHLEMGTPLIGYLTDRRLEAARNLLQETSLNVSEIAWSCGFSSPSYFNRVFRSHTGTTPLAFRQQSTRS